MQLQMSSRWRSQPVREEGQACRTWLHLLRALQAAGPSSCWWRDLAQASITAEDQNPLSPLKRVEPVIKGDDNHRHSIGTRTLARHFCLDSRIVCGLRSVEV